MASDLCNWGNNQTLHVLVQTTIPNLLRQYVDSQSMMEHASNCIRAGLLHVTRILDVENVFNDVMSYFQIITDILRRHRQCPTVIWPLISALLCLQNQGNLFDCDFVILLPDEGAEGESGALSHQIQEELLRTPFLREVYRTCKYYEDQPPARITVGTKNVKIAPEMQRFMNKIVQCHSCWSDSYSRIDEECRSGGRGVYVVETAEQQEQEEEGECT